MDLRVHPAVRPLTPEYLAQAHQATNQQQTNGESKPKPVILAPFGLAATLTGQSFRILDPVTQKAFDDWCSFYPLCNRENSNLPPMVEVISGKMDKKILQMFLGLYCIFFLFLGGVKMRYPSKYVLVTDLDDEDFETKCSTIVPSIPISEKSINDLGHPGSQHHPMSSVNTIPERVWQECITNSVITCPLKDENRDSSSGSMNNNNNNNNDHKPLWNFSDPTQKLSCICTK